MICVHEVNEAAQHPKYFQEVCDVMKKAKNCIFKEKDFEIFLNYLQRRFKESVPESKGADLSITASDDSICVRLRPKDKDSWVCRLYAVKAEMYFYDSILDNFVSGGGEQW